MSWFRKKAAVVANPPILNPSATDDRAFAEWRVAHLERWFEDPANADEPAAKLQHLSAELAMYRAFLQMPPKE